MIGNGDITTPAKLVEAFERYNVDGVMVGRASIGAPWIFRQMKGLLTQGTIPEITVAEKFALLRRQIHECGRIDEYRGYPAHKASSGCIAAFQEYSGLRPTRIEMLKADTLDSLEAVLTRIETEILPSIGETV